MTRFITESKLNNQPALVIITRVVQALGASGAVTWISQRTAASSFLRFSELENCQFWLFEENQRIVNPCYFKNLKKNLQFIIYEGREFSLFCFVVMRSTELGCFRLCSWCLWKALLLDEEGSMGLVPWWLGVFWTCSAKVLEYWKNSSLKIKLN